MSTTAADIAHALGGKMTGKGKWTCRCPAHKETNPSFSVAEGDDGSPLFYCHAGCTQDAVIDALCDRGLWHKAGSYTNGNGWSATDFNAARRQRTKVHAKPKPEPEPESPWGQWQEVSPPYAYTDADGKLLYQVLRKERFNAAGDKQKDFIQRRPDGNGGWIYKQGDTRVLYRWPDLVAYPDATLFVCEGEKDTDRVVSLGHCATTVANGNWKDVDVTCVAGRDVIVLEDADDTGVDKAAKAAAKLHGVAETLRIVRLPGHEHTAEKHGKDVSDWLEEDPGNAAKLVDVCFAAPLWEEAPPLVPNESDVKLEDFVAYMPTSNFIFKPTREMWPASSVNGRVPPVSVDQKKPVPAATWIKKHAPVEQMTWSPGEPMLIKDRLIADGGWFERKGCTVFNLYRPPTIVRGRANEAGPWLDHIRKIYPNDADHLVKWLAHRVQRPQEKINHAIVLGGAQGIGKDTLLEPAKHAIGPWNFSEVSPQQMLGRFNGFVKSVILRVSEARDLGDMDRFAFYDHLKAYTAAPPDVLRCDEKNLREHSVLNCCGVIITTNHKVDGIYLPADDRRHFVAWSDMSKSDFDEDYWIKLWQWYAGGGNRHVAAYLAGLDISAFDAKAPPPKTEAFWAIVDANRAPEDGELADAMDTLGWPDIVTISQVSEYSGGTFSEWLRDRKNARRIPHRFEACGYVAVRNDSAKDGQWKIEGKRQVVYGKAELPLQKRIAAARMRSGGW